MTSENPVLKANDQLEDWTDTDLVSQTAHMLNTRMHTNKRKIRDISAK